MPKGRKLMVDLEDLKEVFNKYAETLQNPNIKSNDPIFTTISTELNFKMSPLALFLTLKRKRNILFPNYITIHKKQTDEKYPVESSSSSSGCISNTLFEDSEFYSEKSIQKETKVFSYQMDLYDWKKIQPLYAYQKRSGTDTYKKYRTMPKFKWSHLLKENIYKFTKLPCTWTLRREKVVKNKIFVKGICSQCKSCVQIKSYKTTDKIHTIFCKITNIDKTFIHNPKKKFKLTPYKRQKLAKILKNEPAIVVHNELASKIIGDKEDENAVTNVPAIPSLSAIRQIKSEARRTQWLHPNPIISLLAMAKTTHKDVIRSITVHPDFSIYYWSDEQINYYNEYLRKFKRVTITIDATGSFFETMRLPDGTKITKRKFLYAGLITANHKLKSVPVLQMVTDAHGKQSIFNWLNQWKREIQTSPHEIITDDSSALIAASVEAFTVYVSAKDYIIKLFSILEGQATEIPSTFIRLDSSHFLKTVHNLKCFINVDPRIKYFYIRCIMFLKVCEDFETAKKFIIDMITVSLFQLDDLTPSSSYQAALSRLLVRMKSIKLDRTEELGTTGDDTLLEKNNNQEYPTADLNFFVWFDVQVAHLQKQLKEIKVENKNLYFYPPFVSEFRRILWKLPLWSNLLCPFFKIDNIAPSSSGIESYFKTLKHLLFRTKLKKYRIDEFIKMHYNYLNTEIALASCDLVNDIQNKEAKRSRKRKHSMTKSQTQVKKRKISKSNKINRSFPPESIFSDHPSFIENWRGEADSNMTSNKINVKFVKNGNLCDAVSVGNGDKVCLKNTCCFDSVMHFFSIAYIQSRNFQEILYRYSDDLIPQYIKLLSEPVANNYDVYKMRHEIGVLYFDVRESLCEFACNASFIFEHIALKYFFSAIFSKKCINDSCQFRPVSRQVAFLPLNLNIISVFGISSLEDSICITEEKRNCTYCNQETVCKYNLSKTVSLEINLNKTFAVSEVPQSIIISNKSFSLLGVIEFVPPISEVGMGHYKCHYPIKDEMFCYDDCDYKIRKSTDQPILIHTITYVEND